MFVIEDEIHAEIIGEFNYREEAVAELRRLSETPWDQTPNLAPCSNWRNCGRRYELIGYDVSVSPWRETERTTVLETSADGVRWLLQE